MARTSAKKIERLTEAQGAAGPAPDRKYEFTGETKTVFGITLRQIRAVRAIGLIAAGTVGGWIESEANLAQVYGNAWVYSDARVSGDARVYGDAWVFGDAQVFGNARVSRSIICATRSDGYTFTLALMGDNTLRVIAGCRFFDMTEARAHWRHRAGTPLGAETDSILDHFERMAAAGALGKPK